MTLADVLAEIKRRNQAWPSHALQGMIAFIEGEKAKKKRYDAARYQKNKASIKVKNCDAHNNSTRG